MILKRFYILSSVILILSAFIGSKSFAGGGHVTGGGNGVERGSAILLQDLVEAGLTERKSHLPYTPGLFAVPVSRLTFLDRETAVVWNKR